MPRLKAVVLCAVLAAVSGPACSVLHGPTKSGCPTFAASPQRDPGAAVTANERGLALAAQGLMTQAEQSFREAVQADVGCVAAHNNLGLVLLGNRRFYEAAVEFQQAGRLDRRAVEPVMNLGRLYEAVGWHEAAIGQYEKALGLQPNNVEAQGRLAQAYTRTGKQPEALRVLLQELSARTTDDVWKFWALNQTGQPSKAIEGTLVR